MKTFIALAMLAVSAISMTVFPAFAHHKPGYHDGLPRPQTPQVPTPHGN